MLDKFLSTFSTYQEPSRFLVRIATPPCLYGSPLATLPASGFLCHRAVLPGRNITTDTLTTYGPTQEIPTGLTVAPIEIAFRVGGRDRQEATSVLRFFREWHNRAVNTETWDVEYYDQLVTTITVDLYHRGRSTNGGIVNNLIGGFLPGFVPAAAPRPVHRCQVLQAFPKTVSDVALDWGVVDQVMEVSVSFTYHHSIDITV